MEESLNMWPDLVGLCPSEALKHTFTPETPKKQNKQLVNLNI